MFLSRTYLFFFIHVLALTSNYCFYFVKNNKALVLSLEYYQININSFIECDNICNDRLCNVLLVLLCFDVYSNKLHFIEFNSQPHSSVKKIFLFQKRHYGEIPGPVPMIFTLKKMICFSNDSDATESTA